MSEYTPSRQELLTALVYYRARDGNAPPPPVSDLATPAEVAQYLAESERGLAEVERAAAEKAWTEGAHAQWRLGQERRLSAIPANPYAKEEHDDQS